MRADAVAVDYVHVTNVFRKNMVLGGHVSTLFNEIENSTFNCYDYVGIVFCLQICLFLPR